MAINTMNDRSLKPNQLTALRALARDPSAFVESGTLGMLRRDGYVGRKVSRDATGHQKTTSPITDHGRTYLASIGS